jgi:hypothetical protein
MSSMSSAIITPAPGPATVRLALIRTGVELFGLVTVRGELFPTIRSCSIQIRPPEKVAISPHRLRAQKWEAGKAGKSDFIQESVMVREMAHASGLMTIYIEVSAQEEEQYRALLQAIGYWGQTDSFAYCVGIAQMTPDPRECVRPLSAFSNNQLLQPFFSCLLTEFRDRQLTWKEITSRLSAGKAQALRLDVYVWPMVVERWQGESKLLVRRCFIEGV